jgi:hypothetical protein
MYFGIGFVGINLFRTNLVRIDLFRTNFVRIDLFITKLLRIDSLKAYFVVTINFESFMEEIIESVLTMIKFD